MEPRRNHPGILSLPISALGLRLRSLYQIDHAREELNGQALSRMLRFRYRHVATTLRQHEMI